MHSKAPRFGVSVPHCRSGYDQRLYHRLSLSDDLFVLFQSGGHVPTRQRRQERLLALFQHSNLGQHPQVRVV